jgi:hypothetical protein
MAPTADVEITYIEKLALYFGAKSRMAVKEVMARTPMNILEFLSAEEHQVLVSIHRMREEFTALGKLCTGVLS